MGDTGEYGWQDLIAQASGYYYEPSILQECMTMAGQIKGCPSTGSLLFIRRVFTV